MTADIVRLDARDFGFRADGVADNAAAGKRLRAHLRAAPRERLHELHMPAGTYCFANPSWFCAYKRLRIVGHGAVWKSTVQRSYPSGGYMPYGGAFWTANVDRYWSYDPPPPTPWFDTGAAILSAARGDASVTLRNAIDARVFAAGDYVLVHAGVMDPSGTNPLFPKYAMFNRVASRDGSTVQLSEPLRHDFSADWPLVRLGESPKVPLGPARIVRLTDRDTWPWQTEIYGVTFLNSGAQAALALRGWSFLLSECRLDDGLKVWPGDARRVEIRNCHGPRVLLEPDKNLEELEIVGGTLHGYVEATGVERIRAKGTRFTTPILSGAREVVLEDVVGEGPVLIRPTYSRGGRSLKISGSRVEGRRGDVAYAVLTDGFTHAIAEMDGDAVLEAPAAPGAEEHYGRLFWRLDLGDLVFAPETGVFGRLRRIDYLPERRRYRFAFDWNGAAPGPGERLHIPGFQHVEIDGLTCRDPGLQPVGPWLGPLTDRAGRLGRIVLGPDMIDPAAAVHAVWVGTWLQAVELEVMEPSPDAGRLWIDGLGVPLEADLGRAGRQRLEAAPPGRPEPPAPSLPWRYTHYVNVVRTPVPLPGRSAWRLVLETLPIVPDSG